MITTTNISTFQAIKKPIFFPRFNSVLPDDAVKLAYTATEPIDADNNIAIIDRSKSIPANAISYIPEDETSVCESIMSLYADIIITDVFTTPIPSQPVKPLFYVHMLDADTIASSVTILDKSFNQVSSSQYVVSTIYVRDGSGTETAVVESVAVYNDLSNTYDDDTGELTVYYIQYTNDSNVTYTIMLSNEPVFHEASFEDIDWTTSRIKTWAKAYSVTDIGTYFEFGLPKSNTYGIRYLETPSIEVLQPAVDENSVPWFPRICNGELITTHNNVQYTYNLPEFNDQSFNPFAPYKMSASELCEVVTDNIIALAYKPTAIDVWPLDVVIQNKHGQPLYAFTTNPGKHGTDYIVDGADTGINWDANQILSYDIQSGLVQLNVRLYDYYQVYTTYYYTEKYYEYLLVNLNPLTNQETLEHFYVVYLVPKSSTNGNLAGRTGAIHYLKVGRDGLIKFCSQDEATDGNEVLSLLNTSYANFITNYSVECGTSDPGAEKRYLILAEVSTKQHTAIDETIILDDRQHGGGLLEDVVTDCKTINSEVLWYTDIGMGGGLPYPGQASVIVELPHCLLDTYGGRFSEAALTEIVKNHMPFGSYPIIRYYGLTPQLTIADDIAPGEVKIAWSSFGSSTTYDVYVSTGGDFTKDNLTPIVDVLAGNTYTLSTVTPGTIYQIYVQASNNNPCTLPQEVGNPGTRFFIGGDNGDAWNTHAGPRSKIIRMVPALNI